VRHQTSSLHGVRQWAAGRLAEANGLEARDGRRVGHDGRHKRDRRSTSWSWVAPHLEHQSRRRSRFVQYAPGARLQWRVWHPCRRCHATSRLCQWCVITMTQRRPFPASWPLLSGAELEATPIGGDLEPQRAVVIQMRQRFRCPLQPSPRATRPRPDTSATLPEKVRAMSGLPGRPRHLTAVSFHPGAVRVRSSDQPRACRPKPPRYSARASRCATHSQPATPAWCEQQPRSEPPHMHEGAAAALDRPRRCAPGARNARRGAFTTCLRHFVDFRGLRPLRRLPWTPSTS